MRIRDEYQPGSEGFGDDAAASLEELDEGHEERRVIDEAKANIAEDSRSGTLIEMLSGSPVRLSWNEVVNLISRLGKVSRHVDDTFVFEVNSRKVSFKRPPGDVVPDYAISALKKFLQEAEEEKIVPGHNDKLIVVIDHHSARLFSASRRADQEGVTEKPYDPHGFHRHLIHRKEAHYKGERVPEDLSFFDRIADDLVGAGPIVILAHGQGKSDEGDLLFAYLTKHHPEVASRVAAIKRGDISASSDAEICAEVSRQIA